MMTARLQVILAEIDAANACDPTLEDDNGARKPAALLYGQRMSLTLTEFAEAPSEALQIAVRGQHIERWTRPRAAYPEGRAGYLQWRRDAAAFHAQRLGGLMTTEGYDPEACAHVTSLVRKLGLKTDADAQMLEDVACLVFMRWYFAPFAQSRTPDQILQIVEKTAKKMSARGREVALNLPLPGHLIPALMNTE